MSSLNSIQHPWGQSVTHTDPQPPTCPVQSLCQHGEYTNRSHARWRVTQFTRQRNAGSNKERVKRVGVRRQTPSRSSCSRHIPCRGKSCALRGGAAFPNDIPFILSYCCAKGFFVLPTLIQLPYLYPLQMISFSALITTFYNFYMCSTNNYNIFFSWISATMQVYESHCACTCSRNWLICSNVFWLSEKEENADWHWTKELEINCWINHWGKMWRG